MVRKIFAGQMPPGNPLPGDEREVIRSWIAAGAPRRLTEQRARPQRRGAGLDWHELAARMQLSAPEANDLSRNTKAPRDLYGADDPNPLLAAYARNCILGRRLTERGVRFVQLFCGSRLQRGRPYRLGCAQYPEARLRETLSSPGPSYCRANQRSEISRASG